MKAEISHPGYRPARHFTGVYHQLGRMLLDRDFNELCDILREQATTVADEAVGTGVPDRNGLIVADPGDPSVLRLSPAGGTVVADGVIGQSLRDPGSKGDLYRNQADLPDEVRVAEPDESDPNQIVPLITATPDGLLLYVDIWDRAVTAFETDSLVAGDLIDPALHGADTSFRSQRQVQIKAARVQDLDPEADPCRPSFLGDRIPSCGTALFSAELIEAAEERDPCDPCAGQVEITRLVENHLFRVEVHDVGYDDERAADRICLKWSNDNGAREFSAADFDTHADPGRHSYEYFSDATERLLGMPSDDWPDTPQLRGILDAELRETDPIETDLINTVLPRVREWDGWCVLARQTADTWKVVEGRSAGAPLAAGAVTIADGVVTVELEDKRFVIDLAGKTMLAGDYWLAVARTRAEPGRRLSIVSAEPLGVKHHYCILGTASVDEEAISLKGLSAHDLRRLQYPSLTCLDAADIGYATDCPSGLFDDGHDTVKKALDQICRIGAEHVAFSAPCNTSVYSQSNAPAIATVADALHLLCDVRADQIGFDPNCEFLVEAGAKNVADALEALCSRAKDSSDLAQIVKASWANDATMTISQFMAGLAITFDRPMLADFVSTDSFVVTWEVPYGLMAVLRQKNDAFPNDDDFLTPQVVSGDAVVEGDTITFQPRLSSNLQEAFDLLVRRASDMKYDFGSGIRCRVRLIGRAIFDENKRPIDGHVPMIPGDRGIELDFESRGLDQVSDFESWFYVVANTSRRLDLNLASRDELMTLPGISRDIADRIIAGRPWSRVDDLTAVNGIGRARVEGLRDRVVIE